MSIKSQKIRALVDTGSHVTCLSSRIVSKIGLTIDSLKTGDAVAYSAANGSKLNVLGTVEVDLVLNGLHVPFTATVIDNLSESCIIGSDFLRYTSAKIDYQQGVVSFEHDLIRLPVSSGVRRVNYVRASVNTVLPPMTGNTVPVRVAKQFIRKDIMIEPHLNNASQNYAVVSCIQRPKSRESFCQMVNFTDGPVVVVKNQKIAVASRINPRRCCKPFRTSIDAVSGSRDRQLGGGDENRSTEQTMVPSKLSDYESFLSEYKFKINPELSEAQQLELCTLLYEFRDTFSRNLKEIGCYKNFEVDLDVIDKKPFYIRQYRMPEFQQKIAQAEIDDMVENGLLVPNPRSKYNSPWLLVKKRNGAHRLVVDLRQGANKVCHSWTFNSKTISEIVDQISMSQSNYYSELDLMSGFWQLSLSPASRDLITITAPNQMRYSATRMPQGLHSSSSFFNLALHTALQSELGANLALYVDDLSCFTETFEEHTRKLRRIFGLMRLNGLTMSPKKCSFGYQHINVLGYKITRDNIELSNEKTKAVTEMPIPKTQKNLRRVYGLFNYFRGFIKNFTQRTANMRALLKKDAKFNFDENCVAEFNDVKSALVAPEVLMPVQSNQNFYLDVDSSSVGYGWVYYQKDPTSGELRPIYFGSVASNKSQQRYASSAAELQGLFVAIKSLQHHTLGRKIFVRTDNVSVKFLASLQARSNREKRIAAFLQSFDLFLIHRPGALHVVPDGLSRIFEDMTQAERVNWQLDEGDDDMILQITQGGACTSTYNKHCCDDDNCDHNLCHMCHGPNDVTVDVTKTRDGNESVGGTKSTLERRASNKIDFGELKRTKTTSTNNSELFSKDQANRIYLDGRDIDLIASPFSSSPQYSVEGPCHDGLEVPTATVVSNVEKGPETVEGHRRGELGRRDAVNDVGPPTFNEVVAVLSPDVYTSQQCDDNIGLDADRLPVELRVGISTIIHKNDDNVNAITRGASKKLESELVDRPTAKPITVCEPHVDVDINIGDMIVSVRNDEIIDLSSEAILNQLSDQLLPQCELSKKIMERFGCQQQCQEYITRHGEVSRNDMIYTKVDGDQNPKYIFHGISPELQTMTDNEKVREITEFYFKAFILADDLEINSMAIKFMVDPQLNVMAFCAAIKSFLSQSTSTHLLQHITIAGIEDTKRIADLLSNQLAADQLAVDQHQHQTSPAQADADPIDMPHSATLRLTPADYIQDAYFGPMYKYKRDGEVPTSNQMATKVISQADMYFIGQDDLLYKLTEPRSKKQKRIEPLLIQLVIPKKYVSLVVRYLHAVMAHPALDVMFLSIRAQFYFEEMYAIISDYYRQCQRCALVKSQGKLHKAPLRPIKVSRLFEVVSLDLITYSKPSKNGMRHIFAAVDHLTNYAILAGMRSATAEETVQCLVDKVIFRISCPGCILTDRGSGFTSMLYREIVKRLGISIRLISTGRANANARVERLNKDIHSILRSMNANHDNWDEYIPAVEFALNSTTHSRTMISPFEAVFGLKPQFAISNMFQTDIVPDIPDTKDRQTFTILAQRLESLRQRVAENREISQSTNEKYYNDRNKVKLPDYHTGDIVYVRRSGIRADKFEEKYTGPYTIEQVYDTSEYGQHVRLVNLANGKRLKSLLHTDRVKLANVTKHNKPSRFPLIEVTKAGADGLKEPALILLRYHDGNANDAAVLPPAGQTPSVGTAVTEDTTELKYEPALKILRKRGSGKGLEYLVLFKDQSTDWCGAEYVGLTLVRDYRVRLANRKRGRGKRRGFNDRYMQ